MQSFLLLGEEYVFFLKPLSCFISIMFPILTSGFYCDKELQELPLVHEVIFEKHTDKVCDAYRLRHPLYVFHVMTPDPLDWKLIGSDLFEGIFL